MLYPVTARPSGSPKCIVGTGMRRTGREEGLEAELAVGGADEGLQAALGRAQGRQILVRLPPVQLLQLRLHLGHSQRISSSFIFFHIEYIEYMSSTSLFGLVIMPKLLQPDLLMGSPTYVLDRIFSSTHIMAIHNQYFSAHHRIQMPRLGGHDDDLAVLCGRMLPYGGRMRVAGALRLGRLAVDYQ